MLQQTAAICVGESDRELMASYVDGAIARIADQITHLVVGNEWESVTDVKSMFQEVRELVQPDLDRIAQKLDEKHDWNPTVKPRNKFEKEQDAKALLSVSLLVGGTK